MSLYLGLDSSTQSLSAVIIEVTPSDERRIVFELSLNFDEWLPGYGTQSGVFQDESDPTVVHSSPILWAEALDLLFHRMRDEGVELDRVAAISGSGQQHGSVYLAAGSEEGLCAADTDRTLVQHLQGYLTRSSSPIWMDSSTSKECEEITAALGGDVAVAELTGSRAFARFTGPQIRKFYKQEPQAYEMTGRVHLVSSFMASLLAGKHAPIDAGDGAGMNLMDIGSRSWAAPALDATAPGLAEKLPEVADSWTIVGKVSPYFVGRYGFNPEARVVAWSGDNPCSLIGVGLVSAGQVAISLGTSDTLFGVMPELRVDPACEGHVFGSPTGEYMSLICFKNGSLAREKVRDRYGLDWNGFNEALRAAPPGNNGAVLLPWFDPEITPTVLDAGPRLFDLDWDDRPAVVRAVLEAQMASMRIHSQWMDVETKTIYATGGGATNRDILQVMADVFEAEVLPSSVGQTAALGAALRAWHAERLAAGEKRSWDDIVAGLTDPQHSERVTPNPENSQVYRTFVSRYSELEQDAIGA
jgi:xylulokinase